VTSQHLTQAFRRAEADIASLADWIECELDKHDDAEVTYASLNTLESVRDSLIETLSLFSGVKPAEIQRSLDELHGVPDDNCTM